MRCCETCFNENFLKDSIQRHGRRGTCQYCQGRGVYIIEAADLEPQFTRFTDLYSPANSGVNIPPDVDVLRMASQLATLIQDQWDSLQ